MKYKFEDGSEVELERIISVSPIRDLGVDKKSISTSKIGFTVHMSKREIVHITRDYHYSDWAGAKIELEKERNNLIAKWDEMPKKS